MGSISAPSVNMALQDLHYQKVVPDASQDAISGNPFHITFFQKSMFNNL